MGAGILLGKKRDFGLLRNIMLFVECLLSAKAEVGKTILTSRYTAQQGTGQSLHIQ